MECPIGYADGDSDADANVDPDLHVASNRSHSITLAVAGRQKNKKMVAIFRECHSWRQGVARFRINGPGHVPMINFDSLLPAI